VEHDQHVPVKTIILDGWDVKGWNHLDDLVDPGDSSGWCGDGDDMAALGGSDLPLTMIS
jgi:hypothetical protein